MTRQQCKALLKDIFARGVDGGSSDTYAAIYPALKYSVDAGMHNISADDLLDVLRVLSNKWQKEIDKATSVN